MELRGPRRKLNADGLDESSSPSTSVSNNRAFKAFRSLDMFPKAKEDFRRKQNLLGGVISTATVSILALLILYDLMTYVFGWNAYRTELSVDHGVSAAVPFDIDITFFSVPCHQLSLDAVDASGAEQDHLDHDLLKTPVDAHYTLVETGSHKYYDKRSFVKMMMQQKQQQEREGGGSQKVTEQLGKHNRNDPGYCGPCFAEPLTGATPASEAVKRHFASGKDHEKACCNTCDDVMKMYDKHKLTRPSMNEVEQCIMELSHRHPGCNVKGLIYVRKVMGAIFFAPGRGQQLGPLGGHVHVFTFDQLLSFNSSHQINRFRIGDPSIPRFSADGVSFSLENRRFVVPAGAQGSIKYKLQIVPTAYRVAQSSATDRSFSDSSSSSSSSPGDSPNSLATEDRMEESEVSYEYSASEWHRITPGGLFSLFGGATPGVLFRYDYFSMQLTHVFDRPPLSVFFVRACSIIGGLFVILGLVDRFTQFLAKNVEWEKLFGPEVATTVHKWLSYEM